MVDPRVSFFLHAKQMTLTCSLSTHHSQFYLHLRRPHQFAPGCLVPHQTPCSSAEAAVHPRRICCLCHNVAIKLFIVRASPQASSCAFSRTVSQEQMPTCSERAAYTRASATRASELHTQGCTQRVQGCMQRAQGSLIPAI